MIKKCQICNKDFKVIESLVKKGFGKFCSMKCMGVFFKKVRTRKINLAEKNGQWKGDKVKYSSLHFWVRRWKGRADRCEMCGKEGKPGRESFHWANIDHKYRRILDDYISLCRKCHGEYDRNLITVKK